MLAAPETPRSNVTLFPAHRAGHAAPTASTIVVPCYNEAERLNAEAFLAHLAEDRGLTLVMVNDGSRDATLDRLRDLQAAAPGRIEVLDLERNSGKAEAVRQGLRHAVESGATLVGYWDADLATPLDAIGDFARVMTRLPDTQVVYGARLALPGHRVHRTPGRRLVSRLCATLARRAVRMPIGDTQCGAKMLRNTEALRVALDRPFTAGWLFDVELFTRLSQQVANRGTAFYEYPLAEWEEVAGSKVSGRAILRAGLRMLRLIAETRLGLPERAVETAEVGVTVIAPEAHRVAA